MPPAITFDDVGKVYSLTAAGSSLRDALSARVFRRAAPPLGPVVALDQMSFDVQVGESVGLIGRNGAGKTTALKIATRVVRPTSGTVRIRGRVGALIEVGTGLHPDLTGRENIDLFGRILGLSRRDVAQRFDSIVEFAAINEAIDRPVRQYSSGMQLRLGFSIAAHLEPDILIVDEAMAVGDAAFQFKCIERMSRLVREGRTLLFVSHDLPSIEAVCARAICLSRGRLIKDGPAREVVEAYLVEVNRDIAEQDEVVRAEIGDKLRLLGVSLHDRDGRPLDEAASGRPLVVRLRYDAIEPIANAQFSVGISDGRPRPITLASTLVDGSGPAVVTGPGWIECAFEDLPLNAGAFEIWGSVRTEDGNAPLVGWRRLHRFVVTRPAGAQGKMGVTGASLSPVVVPHGWRWSGAAASDAQA
ncbi:MAG TPA: ABC transporter ATP-binding protein [Candidatus Dormibacteraeota bacterium]